MLRMMTYQEVNDILYTRLVPDNRCISRGVGESNGAEFDDFIAANTPAGADPTVLFPLNRLMPVDAMENEPSPSSCALPFDDMVMTMQGYSADSGSGQPSSMTGYDFYIGDIAAAGYVYNLERVIVGNNTYIPSYTRLTESSTSSVGFQVPGTDWLYIKLRPENSAVSISHNAGGESGSTASRSWNAGNWNYAGVHRYDSTTPNLNGGNHFTLMRNGQVSFGNIEYYVKENAANQPYREVKLVFSAQKNQSISANLESAVQYWNTNNPNDICEIVDDACSLFVVTLRQRAGEGGSNGEGTTISQYTLSDDSDVLNLNFSSPVNTELDFVVYGTASVGGDGYWSNYTTYNINSGYENIVRISGSENNKSIAIQPQLLDNDYSQTSNRTVTMYVVATWSGCLDSYRNKPPQPNIPTNGSCMLTTNVNNGQNTIQTLHVNGASVLNFSKLNDNLNQFAERGSTVLQIIYHIDGDRTIEVRTTDSTYKYHDTYIHPVFYPTNFEWINGGTLTGRNYQAKSVTTSSIETISIVSTINSRNSGYRISMCDRNGNALTSSDQSTYAISASNGVRGTIDYDTPLNVNSYAGQFTIDFANADIISGSTKYFKIEQLKNSVIPTIGENISPEYAIIGFTFNE